MNKTFLDPQYRSRMRDLIQGFIEHCEFSESLVGQIERFVSFQGRKYGFPTFTVAGPAQPGMETASVNLIGINEGEGKVAAETLLQLIERLAMQPKIAAGHILRILPVSDPLALELGPSIYPPEVVAGLRSQVDAFRDEAAGGLIELHLTGGDTFKVHAHGPAEVLGAARNAEEALRRLQAEDFQDAVASRLLETIDRGPWVLHLAIPRTWPALLAVHWTSQFLVVFFRAHAAALHAGRSVHA